MDSGCEWHISHPDHLSVSCAQSLQETEVCETMAPAIYTAKSLPGVELNTKNSGLGVYWVLWEAYLRRITILGAVNPLDPLAPKIQVHTQSSSQASPIGCSTCHLFPLLDASAGVAVKCVGCYSWFRDLPRPQPWKLKLDAVVSISLLPVCSQSCETRLTRDDQGPDATVCPPQKQSILMGMRARYPPQAGQQRPFSPSLYPALFLSS